MLSLRGERLAGAGLLSPYRLASWIHPFSPSPWPLCGTGASHLARSGESCRAAPFPLTRGPGLAGSPCVLGRAHSWSPSPGLPGACSWLSWKELFHTSHMAALKTTGLVPCHHAAAILPGPHTWPGPTAPRGGSLPRVSGAPAQRLFPAPGPAVVLGKAVADVLPL